MRSFAAAVRPLTWNRAMPELPDVEVFRRRVEENALRRPVETVSVPSTELLVDTSPTSLRDALLGHTLQETVRHGKHLFIRSGEDRRRWLRLHFGMTGSVETWDEGEEPDHTHLRLDLRGGRHLAYRCPRKFGEIGLVDDPAAFVEEKGLGPDARGGGVGSGTFAAEDLRRRLQGRRGALKTTLMDQSVVAGLGNVYVDEILFQAGWHPETLVDALTPGQLDHLRETMASVLETAIRQEADVDRLGGRWLLPRRKDGAPCGRCGGTIVRTEVSGRATYHCRDHQSRA